MSRSLRHSSERLANILNSLPYPGQADDLKQTLSDSKSNGFQLVTLINYNIPRYNGRTLVHIAANNGLFECLEELLRLGGDPNAVSFASDLCQTPLHLAAEKGRARCLQVLLENHADMFLENSHRVKPGELVSGKKVCEKMFQHAIAKITIPARTREQQQRVVDMHQYVEDGEDLPQFYNMYESLPPGHMDLATRWNDLSQTLLFRACSKERFDVVQFLLSRSSSEPLSNLSSNESSIHIACEKGNHKIAHALLEHSPKLMFSVLQIDSVTLLHVACRKGDLEMVRIICDHIRSYIQTADIREGDTLPPDMRDKVGCTPFFIACFYGYVEIVRELCKLKERLGKVMTLNVNAQLHDTNRTPLHAAVSQGSFDTVHLLLTLEDTDKNIEARPSPATQEKFLRNIEKTRHGCLLLSYESDLSLSVENPISRSPTDANIRGTPPTHFGTMVDHGDSGGKGGGGVTHATTSTGRSLHSLEEIETTTTYPSASTISNFTLPPPRKVPSSQKPRKKASTPKLKGGTSDIDGVMSEGEARALGIFLNQRDELVVGKKERTSGTAFNQLMVTPLAEACALGSSEIAEELLSYGGYDASGLACRIAHLTHSYDLMQHILSRCCTVAKERINRGSSTADDQQSSQTAQGLRISWNSKKLPEVRGEWFCDSAAYYLDKPRSGEEKESDDDVTMSEANINLRRVEPLSLRRLTLSEMPIKELNLSKNNLKSLPLQLFQLEHLTELLVQHNRIVELPEPPGGEMWKCTRLEQVNLSHNNLLHLPSCLWMLPNLRKICASHNNLVAFPEVDVPQGELSKVLVSIDLSHNYICPTLPAFIFEFPSLKKAYFTENKLSQLPDTVWLCPTLQELVVSHNELESLPWCEPCSETSSASDGVGGTTILQQSAQVLTAVVQVKGHMADNPYLRQKSTYYHSIKPSGGELSWVNYGAVNTESYDYSQLMKLDVSKNKLATFPEALPCLAPNLTELNISQNPVHFIDLQYIPQSLKKLMCRNCEVELIGNVISADQFKQVARNCRCPLDPFQGKPCQHRNHPRLNHLTTLHLGHNRIRHFQLMHHYHAHSPLKDRDPGNQPREKIYQASLSSLDLLYPALENLDLSFNNLQGLFNPNIGHQTHLKSIKLNDNPKLERIPYEFSCLKRSKDFTELTMSNLPNLYEPPVEYQTAELSHVLTFMRSFLKESVAHRTIKLFFIGNGERGKTTLLRRLRGLSEERTDRTEGIDIEDWHYAPSPGRLKFTAPKPQVHFLAWDFAGQDVYHTTHQCFYSRRSLYLALFRLTDREKGVDELDPWLRNVKLRAPGSVVVIVGTYMDMMREHHEIRRLEQYAMDKYAASDQSKYPKVVYVVSVSCKKTFLSRNNNIEKLSVKLYDIACHLQLASDGVTLDYKDGCREDSPKCLFQLQVPKSFLRLQDRVREVVASYRVNGTIPIMEEGEFRVHFKDLFDDDEEMNEAVFFLNLQGTLLHFEDHGLKETYFLDPQWLAKLMASVIHPAAEEGKSPIKKGMAEVCSLFQDAPDGLRKKYIQLLEKFEVALQLTDTQVIIPSLMPTEANYPKPNDKLSDIGMNVDNFYQPPMRRFWLAEHIPEGFWPRLICRIATDHQIGKTLRNVIRNDPKMASAQDSMPHYKLNWIPWRSGITFVDHGRTLLVIREMENEGPPPDSPYSQVKCLRGKLRIEAHVYAPDWITLVTEWSGEDGGGVDPHSLTAMATQLLITISKHIQTLASDWFQDLLVKVEDHLPPPVHLPCWKCYGHKSFDGQPDSRWDMGNWVFHDGLPVFCFTLNESIIPAALGDDLECPLHGKILIKHTAPDLVFCDLSNTSTYYQDNSIPLKIHSDKVLGKGGFGFVCEGELTLISETKKKVAVKVFLQEIAADIDNFSASELLEKARQPRHLLHAYKEIRQEVAFLSALDHPHLTQLCGVRTRPNICLLLELAPLGSLRVMLKEYQNNNLVLEPLTLKTTTLQITKGLEFLHQHQIVHLDMKSPNVLVWYFPSADYKHQDRVRYAGNVWLKLADYGISQVSTGFVMRVRSTPVGTPGYMAPELFDHLGQQVSSEKVDVFGFGMTLYELLSLSPPFSHIVPPFKRNTELRDKHRPLLKARQTRSLVLLQELMRLCWDHDPDKRPRMSQIREWVAAEEFERLRAEVALSDVHSISCACVCRIMPENEEEFTANFNQFSGHPNRFNGYPDEEGENIKYLPSVLEDSGHVKFTDTAQDVCLEENVYQFIPTSHQCFSPGVVLDHAYTQIWMCGRDQKKGLLHIFTYYDGQPGFHTFAGYCSKEEVLALCPVRNMMWMGTTTGTLKVFHAPSLKAKYTGKLVLGFGNPSCILNILHVESISCVLVSTASGEIWSFHDSLAPEGLIIQCRLTLTDNFQCYHLVAVESEDSVEVWGTMDNSQLCLLESDGAGWKSQEIKVNTGDPKLRVCSHIALAHFKDKRGVLQNHLWISYRSRGVLVAWDATSRQQIAVVNCNHSYQQLKADKDSTFQVSTLTAHGKKVFFGTDAGSVGIIDSETHQLLRALHWYNGKVRTLLVMPKEVECCICAEVPSPSAAKETADKQKSHYPKPPDPFKNPHNINIKDRNAIMVTTFGNGRRKYAVHTVTKSERTKQFDKAFMLPQPARTSQQHMHENVSLLSWKS